MDYREDQRSVEFEAAAAARWTSRMFGSALRRPENETYLPASRSCVHIWRSKTSLAEAAEEVTEGKEITAVVVEWKDEEAEEKVPLGAKESRIATRFLRCT